MATLPVYPYGDTANRILNSARIRVNDLIGTSQSFPGGSDDGKQFDEVGGGTAAPERNPDGSIVYRTQIVFNNAYRKLQKYLANLGYRLLIGDNLQITALPINSNPDPSVQSWLSWNGFFNGTAFTNTPTLPLDFYAPLKIRERISGTNAIFIPMRCGLDGLSNGYVRVVLNRQWEWRTNALYLPGATSLTDLQIRYIRYLPTLPDPNYYIANTPWYNQQIPIVGVTSALSWYIAHEIIQAKEDMEDVTTRVLALAEDEANKIFNDQARADQRTNCRRRPRGGSSRQQGSGYGLF